MKKIIITSLLVVFCLSLALPAVADYREHPYKEFFFGDSFHKSPSAVKLNFLKVQWNDQGVSELKFKISAWKGRVVWQDLYFVGQKGDQQVIAYKLSDKMKMGQEICLLDCPYKTYLDTMYFVPPVTPFNLETGQIWFVFTHGKQFYHIVWDMKSDEINWFKAEDKPLPTIFKK